MYYLLALIMAAPELVTTLRCYKGLHGTALEIVERNETENETYMCQYEPKNPCKFDKPAEYGIEKFDRFFTNYCWTRNRVACFCASNLCNGNYGLLLRTWRNTDNTDDEKYGCVERHFEKLLAKGSTYGTVFDALSDKNTTPPTEPLTENTLKSRQVTPLSVNMSKEVVRLTDQHSSTDATPTEDKHTSSIQSGNKSSGSKITTSEAETQKYEAVTNSLKTPVSTAIASGLLSTINAATAENGSITSNNPESDRITYGNVVTSNVQADLKHNEQSNSSRTPRALKLQSSTEAAKINSRAKRGGDKPASTTTNSKAETQEDGLLSSTSIAPTEDKSTFGMNTDFSKADSGNTTILVNMQADDKTSASEITTSKSKVYEHGILTNSPRIPVQIAVVSSSLSTVNVALENSSTASTRPETDSISSGSVATSNVGSGVQLDEHNSSRTPRLLLELQSSTTEIAKINSRAKRGEFLLFENSTASGKITASKDVVEAGSFTSLAGILAIMQTKLSALERSTTTHGKTATSESVTQEGVNKMVTVRSDEELPSLAKPPKVQRSVDYSKNAFDSVKINDDEIMKIARSGKDVYNWTLFTVLAIIAVILILIVIPLLLFFIARVDN